MTAPSTPQIPDELRPYLDTIADRLLSGLGPLSLARSDLHVK